MLRLIPVTEDKLLSDYLLKVLLLMESLYVCFSGLFNLPRAQLSCVACLHRIVLALTISSFFFPVFFLFVCLFHSIEKPREDMLKPLCSCFQFQSLPFPCRGSCYSEIGDDISFPCFQMFSSYIGSLTIFYIDSCFKIYICIHIMYVSFNIMFLYFLFKTYLIFFHSHSFLIPAVDYQYLKFFFSFNFPLFSSFGLEIIFHFFIIYSKKFLTKCQVNQYLCSLLN